MYIIFLTKETETNQKKLKIMTDYPFYYDPIMDSSVYEKLTEEELKEISKTALGYIFATIAAIISTGIFAGVLHLLKVI